jgi:XTP/dITP diphosphohydrolase
MPSRADSPLLLATRSRDKAREIREILAPLTRAAIVTPDDVDIPPSLAEDGLEIHETFLANAHAKAEYFLRIAGLPTLADDSGINVHALGGRPGVRSKRFAANAGLSGSALDRANNDRLLHELHDTPHEQRTAHYTCAAVLHLPDNHRFAAIGTCSGCILTEPRGTHGFGYDPLFLDPATGLSFGQLEPALKHRKSHRARAFRALAAFLPGPGATSWL